MRYEHYLASTTGNSLPTTILALAVRGYATNESRHSARIVEDLDEWAITATSGRKGVYGVHRRFQGFSRVTFWNAMDTFLSKRGVTWIFCEHTCNAVALLGLWELLEKGELDFRANNNPSHKNVSPMPKVREALGTTSTMGRQRECGTVLQDVRQDSSNCDDKVRFRRRKRGSMDAVCSAIIEDTPTCIRIKRPAKPGSLKIVDIANYGIPARPCTVNAKDNADALLTAALGIVHAVKSNRLGSLQITVAGQAFYSFRRRYMRDAFLCHTVKSVLDLEGESYVGGRCECFRIGAIKGNVAQFDFRSMYAACYASNPVPIALSDTGTLRDKSFTAAKWKPNESIASVLVETSERSYPKKHSDLVIWPVGRFKTTLCGPELVDAIEHGRVKEIYNVARYRMSTALHDFATAVHEMRCKAEDQGNTDLSAFYKLLLVSLPGKLASKERRWVDDLFAPSDRPYGRYYAVGKSNELIACRILAWRVQREIIGSWSSNAAPAVASWVTSLGRMLLLNAIRCAGWGDVYYVDTDALIVSESAEKRLRFQFPGNSGMLGSLTHKGTSTDTEIHAIKHYRFGGRLVCAGLPKTATPVEGREGLYYRRETAASQAMAGNRPQSAGWYFARRNGASYRHGMVDSSGRVHPFVLAGE